VLLSLGFVWIKKNKLTYIGIRIISYVIKLKQNKLFYDLPLVIIIQYNNNRIIRK